MEDPDKKILDWCGHLAVPRLVDEKAYSNCKGCNTAFGGFLSKQKQHHCRLCGQMYCSACTAKYHVPLIFRIKNKDGPTRVCMSCVEGCMAEKAKATGTGSASGSGGPPGSGSSALSSGGASTAISASLQSMAKVVEIAPPDVWEEEVAFLQCPKCSAKKCKTHNCRVCGKLFCDKCTSKMEIPSYFEKKKGKTGPSRVCDGCRFKIVSSGAKLVEKLSSPQAPIGGKKVPPPPPAGFIGISRRPSSFASKCSTPGCLNPPAGGGGPTAGKCASHGGEPAKSAEDAVAIPAQVKREGSDQVIAKLTIPSGDTTLAAIDVLLKKTAPQTEAYSYVFRGEPVPEAFYPVFLARSLGATLFIRPKRKALMGIQEEMSISELSNGSDGSCGVSSVNNPFKSDPALEAKRQQAKKEREEKAAKKPLIFKKPTIGAKFMKVESKPPGSKKVPPPPPGSATSSAAVATSAAAALASGVPLEEVCKARAKKIFGQL